MPDFMAKKFAMQLNQIVVPQSESYILFAVCKHSPAAFLKNAKKICRERFSLGISHISRQKEQKSCLQSVPEAKENVGAPVQRLSVESHAIVLKGDL